MAKAKLTIQFGTKDITIRCHKCKGLDFDIPREPKPEDLITCLGCGESGPYGEITTAALEKLHQKRDEIISVLIRGGKTTH